MKAMILAAGRGERMGELTANTPKPLLPVAGRPLIVWQIERLQAAGFVDLVINTGYLGARIETALGDGAALGVTIHYSAEPEQPLGTGRGIQKALPLLGTAPFLLVNADVWCDFPLAALRERPVDLAHLLLTANPAHHRGGDFALANGKVLNRGAPLLTYAGIALLHPGLFDGIAQPAFELAPLLRKAADSGRVSAERYDGTWVDVGTPQRLTEVQRLVQRGADAGSESEETK